MTLLEKLKKNLPAEVFAQVEEALGDFDTDLIPRTRLNKVIGERNELRDKVAELEEGAGSKNVDLEKFVPKADHDKAIAEAQAASAQAVQDLKLQYAGLDKLRGAKAVDPDLVWNSLIDKTKLSFNDKNELVGLDDQLTELTKNKSFLFPKEEPGAGGTGKTGGKGDDNKSPLDAQLAKVFGAFTFGEETK